MGAPNPAGLQTSQDYKEGSKPSWRNLGSDREPNHASVPILPFSVSQLERGMAPTATVLSTSQGRREKSDRLRESSQGRGRDRGRVCRPCEDKGISQPRQRQKGRDEN